MNGIMMRLQTTEFTGGIRYGKTYGDAFNASWPFARLIIGTEGIQLNTTFFKNFSFLKQDIAAVSKYSGFFSEGLRIEHHIADYPPFIVFWTSKLEAVSMALSKNGYIFGRDK
jgi:hypothetical protein